MTTSSRILTWLLLVLLVGGHWGMLQVVAWTGMLIDYSRDNTFADAIEMTFGGEYRCEICKQVEAGIADEFGGEERKAPGKCFKVVKLDALVSAMVVVMPLPILTSWLPSHEPAQVVGMVGEPLRRPPRVLG